MVQNPVGFCEIDGNFLLEEYNLMVRAGNFESKGLEARLRFLGSVPSCAMESLCHFGQMLSLPYFPHI